MHESDVVAIQPCSDTEQRIDGNFYSRGENLPNPSYKPVLFVYDTSGNFIKFNEMKRGENTILQCLETYKNSIAKDWLESTHQFESICISERFINMRHRAFESEKYGYGRFWPISDEAKIDRSYNVKQNQSLVPIPIPCSNAIIYHIVTDSVQVLQTQATRRNLVFANAQLCKRLVSAHQVSEDLFLLQIYTTAEIKVSNKPQFYWTAINLNESFVDIPQELKELLKGVEQHSYNAADSRIVEGGLT